MARGPGFRPHYQLRTDLGPIACFPLSTPWSAVRALAHSLRDELSATITVTQIDWGGDFFSACYCRKPK